MLGWSDGKLGFQPLQLDTPANAALTPAVEMGVTPYTNPLKSML